MSSSLRPIARCLAGSAILVALPVLAGDPVQVEVKTGQGSNSMVVVARSGDSGDHALKIESRDGRVIVEAEPDPSRPWLGVLLDDGHAAPAGGRSLTILSIAKDSPASRSGLQAGDVITGIDGKSLDERGELGLLGGHGPGDDINLSLTRDGAERDVRVRLSGHPGRVEFEKADGLDAFAFAGDTLHGLKGLEALKSLQGLESLPGLEGLESAFCFKVGGGPVLGVSVEGMSDQLARYFGTEPGRGVLVKDVVGSSPAERAGIEAGDVILRVGGTEVRSVGDIREALEDLDAGDEVDVEVIRRGERRTFTATMDEPRRGALEAWPGWKQEHAAKLAEELAHARATLESSHHREAMEATREAMERAREEIEKARATVRIEVEEIEEERRSKERRQRDGVGPAERSSTAVYQ